MKHCHLASILVALILGNFQFCDAIEPIRAIVGDQGATARSGPGAQFYATEKIAAGQVVEIYGKHKDGWVAIRPLEDSFSLVRSDRLETTDRTDVARVKSDGTMCCIGTSLATVHELATQVQLRGGELVEVLDRAGVKVNNGSPVGTVWYRITPPAGEFRWISLEDLAMDAQSNSDSAEQKPLLAVWDSLATIASLTPAKTADTRPRPSATNKSTETVSTSEAEDSLNNEPNSRDSGRSASAADGAKQSGWKPKSNAKVDEPASAPATGIETIEIMQTAASSSGQDNSSHQSHAEEIAGGTSVITISPDSNLSELQLDLSLMVAKDIRAWNLMPIQRRLDQVIATSDSKTEIAQASYLRSRVVEFGELQQQYRKIHGLPESTDGAFGAEPANGAAANSGQVRYDGSGWLVPVHSTRRTAPPYALLDAEGNVLKYISPSPGLNLHRYVRKQIGIFGQRGYIPSLKKPHLTAQRIIDLQRHLR